MEIENLNASSILDKAIINTALAIEDEFERTRVLGLLELRAKELKVVSTYKKIFNICEHGLVMQDSTYGVNYTNFSNEYGLSLRCGEWTADNTGVTTYNALGMQIVACFHPITITKRFINIASGMEKIRLSFLGSQGWKDIIVDKEVISSASKIVGLSKYGLSVTSESAKHLVSYLSELDYANRDLIPIQESTTKLGWINGNFVPYYSGITFDGSNDFRNIVNTICECGNYDDWLDIVKKVRKKNRIEPIIYIAASFASVLIEPLGLLPFILNLYSPTGKGKTVLLMIAASIWAKPKVGEYITDPDASRTALEVRDDILNNLPLMLDDLSKIKEKEGSKFSEMIYMFTNGKGRDRSNQNLTLNEQHTWRNTILTGLERPLIDEDMKGGAINRIIDVEMEDGILFDEKEGRETCNIITKNYGFAGKIFIDEIQNVGFEKINEMQLYYQDKIKEINRAKGIENENKQVASMALLIVADYLAEHFIFKDGIRLDIEKCASMLMSVSEISENERAYQKILDEVNININKFVPDERGNYKGEVWGAKEHGYVFIYSVVFKSLADKHNFSKKGFISWGLKNGLVADDNKAKSICGKTHRGCLIKLPEDDENTMPTDEQGFVKVDCKQEELPFN